MKAGTCGTQHYATLNHNRRRLQRSESREKEVLERQRPMTFDEIISQDAHDKSALVFKPAFIVPDVSLEEGVNALEGGNSADGGSIVINRSENPSDEAGDA